MIGTARGVAWLVAAVLGWEWAWRMSKIMTWCTGLALVGAVTGCGQPAAVRAAGSRGTATEAPAPAALTNGGQAYVNSVSCGAAGNCAAGGYYHAGSSREQGFVAAERNGHWGTATEVAFPADLNEDEAGPGA